MIRIGNGPPRMYQETDRWGCLTNTWTTNFWGWIERAKWELVREYQAPVVVAGKTIQQLYDEVDHKIHLSPRCTTIWEMNILTPDKKDHIRCCALLGDENYAGTPAWVPCIGALYPLTKWTWRDANVVLPFLQLRCRMRNR